MSKKDAELQLEQLNKQIDLKSVDNLQKQQVLEAYSPEKQDADTRQSLAKVFVYSFFLLLFLILVATPLYNFLIIKETNEVALLLDLTELMQVYASVVGPILGFVIGYYFKSKSD